MNGTYNAATTACEGATGPRQTISPSPLSPGSPPPPQPVEQEQDILRQQQEMRQRAEQRQRQRQEAQQKRRQEQQQVFERSKQDALRLLKGAGTLSSDNGPSSLQLKSGTPSFGLKANPSGELRLKDPSAISIGNIESSEVDPAFFTKPKQRLRIRYVPNPLQAPKGTWLRYVTSSRAGLILDALEDRGGNLDGAIDYLQQEMIVHGDNRNASSALSYLEGLRTSYVAVGDEYRNNPDYMDTSLLLHAINGGARMSKWPGPNNPDPGSKPINPDDWRVQRASALFAALEAAPGNLSKSYALLRTHPDQIAASNAEYYLRGIYAYWDYLDQTAE